MSSTMRKFLQLLAVILGAFMLVAQNILMELKYFRPLVNDNRAKTEADDLLLFGVDEYKLDNIDQSKPQLQPQPQPQPSEDKTTETVLVASIDGTGSSSSSSSYGYAVGELSPKRDASEEKSEFVGSVGEDVPFQFQFPPPPSKWLDDIDLGSASNFCGINKCFFLSRSNRQRFDELHRHNSNSNSNSNNTYTQQQPTSYGYLIADFKSEKSGQFNHLLKGWNLAKNLSKKFSIRHYLMAAPEQLNCDEDFFTTLLHLTPRSHAGRHVGNPFRKAQKNAKKKKIKNWKKNHTLLVQPIEVASSDAVVFGYTKSDTVEMVYKKMKGLFSSRDSTLFSPLSGSKLIQFEKRLRFDFNATVATLMNSTKGRCLRKDFQVMVDPHTGGIYHIDFDRCFETSLMRFCPPTLQGFAGALLSLRSGGAINATDFDDPAWLFPDCEFQTRNQKKAAEMETKKQQSR